MKSNNLSSIKLNIILYLVLFTAIPLIIASSVTLVNAYKTKKIDLYNNHNQILKQVESDTNKVIQRIEYLGSYIKKNYKEKKEYILNELIELEKNVTAIMILDQNGILKALNTKEKSHIFIGYDFSNNDYFEVIQNGKERYWSKVYFSNTTQSPSISYAIRIDEENIAIVVIDLAVLNEFTEKFIAHDGDYMVRITDADGVFIASPGNLDFVKERKNINLLSRNKEDTTFDKMYNFRDIGAQSNNNKLGWHIIVKEQYKYVFKTFFNVMWFVIIFIVILIIVSIFVARRLAKSLLRPLHEVSESMNKLSHGDYISNFRSSRYIELLQLVSSFSVMQDKIKQREKSLQELNTNLEKKVNEKTKELQQLNESLEIRIEKEVESSRQKELHILETSKMVQMGEMIGNIAHQWRQPLSVISTAASGMRLEKEVGILDDEKLYFYCDSIVENTEHLSDTIETFRNFIRENKERSDVILQERIEISIKIINATLISKHIELIKDLSLENPIKINIILGELSQAIINILNNAKDAIIEKQIEEPWIKISCYEEDKNAILTIEDNAGGIPQEILPRIFEPYFSTKHKSQGTGLGLHMSYKIIVESLRGNIQAKNSENGALFIITLPLS